MTHRRRNPTLVVDEVEWLLRHYSPDMVWVADDVFTIHHGWIRDYAAEMKRRGPANTVRMHLTRRSPERRDA